MTDYREEQEGEVEALRSIYPEDELKGDDPLAVNVPTKRVRTQSLISDFSRHVACPAVISEDPYCLEVKVCIDSDDSQRKWCPQVVIT